MVFSSFTFIFIFLLTSLVVYHIVPYRFKNYFLLIISLLFYAWGEPVYIILMVLSILFNYLCGQYIAMLRLVTPVKKSGVIPEIEIIDVEKEYTVRGFQTQVKEKRNLQKRAKMSLSAAITFNLLILGFFKYFDFVIRNVNHLSGGSLHFRSISLPLGISFYTFQAISYLVDVYRGDVKAQKKFINFALYIAMFPQLIAGPIVRYVDIERQLMKRKLSIVKFGEGARYFITGLAKKVIIANQMGEIFGAVNMAILSGEAVPVALAWIGAMAFTLQIYFDFGGYSDMAIGLGKMFGFDFKENFHYPYTAVSITDFWRKWHISLGTWFREYVYIPLGGNRKGRARQIFNLMVVWFLTGLWHGAEWNFVVWGLYYGIILIFEKFLFDRLLHRLPAFAQHLYVMVIVIIGWVFFFSNDLNGAIGYLHGMFSLHKGGLFDRSVLFTLMNHRILWIVSILCCTEIPNTFMMRQGYYKWRKLVTDMGYIALFLVSVSYLIANTYNPFIYFRF